MQLPVGGPGGYLYPCVDACSPHFDCMQAEMYQAVTKEPAEQRMTT
jgi:hypothetical protein